MSGSNVYWLCDKTQLKLGREQIAYGQKIPDELLRKIHPKTLEKLKDDKKIGSLPTPGRIPGAAELQRKIGELETVVSDQKNQAARVPGLEEELKATKEKSGDVVKKKDGEINVLTTTIEGLREDLANRDKELTSATALAEKSTTLEDENAKLKEDALNATASLKKKDDDIAKLQEDLKKAKKG